MSASAKGKAAAPARNRVRFTLLDTPVEAPAGMTLLNAIQAAGHEYLKGCGCRMGDCGECAVYYRLPGSATTLRDFSCEMRVTEGMEVMEVPFRWNLHYRRSTGAK